LAKIKEAGRNDVLGYSQTPLFGLKDRKDPIPRKRGMGVYIPAGGRCRLLLHRLRCGLRCGFQRSKLRRIQFAILVGIGLGELGLDLG